MENKVESPEKGKPFLTEEDARLEAFEHGFDDLYHASPKTYFIKGFNAAAEKANKRIAELEKALQEKSDDKLLDSFIIVLSLILFLIVIFS